MGKCEKLFPRYYGPFKILKNTGGIGYKLELSKGIRAHPVFHVNKLKRALHPLENVVSPNVLMELIKPLSAPHEPKKFLGFRDRGTGTMCTKKIWSNGRTLKTKLPCGSV